MNFEKLHTVYELKAFRILIKEFRKLSAAMPIDILTPTNAENVLSVFIRKSSLQNALFKIHLMIGQDAGKRQLQEFAKLERGIKRRPASKYPLFSKAFQAWLLNYYQQYGGENITLLTETYVATVVTEIQKSTELNETIEEMRDRILKTVNSPTFYKWQAMRIARTETTFAINSGTEITGDFTEIVMLKKWMTRRDGKERDSHFAADGQLVEKDDLFSVGGEKMKYPGDKSSGASASNLVNCRCERTFIAKRDADGNLVMK